jgi:lysine biosynthesis protein LysW
MSSTYCPNCDATITAGNPQIGDMIRCGECGQELEIISTHPFEVDFPLEQWKDEDWEEDWEDEEEDWDD